MRLEKPVKEALDAYTLKKWREFVPSLSDAQLSELRQLLLNRLTRYGINACFQRMSYEDVLDLADMMDGEESARVQRRTTKRLQRRALTRQQPWLSPGYEHLSPSLRFGVVESGSVDSKHIQPEEKKYESRTRKGRTSRRRN